MIFPLTRLIRSSSFSSQSIAIMVLARVVKVSSPSFFVLFGKGLRWAQALIDRLVWVKFLISIHVIHVCICHSHIFFQLKSLVFRSKFLISFSFNISSSFSKTMVSIPSRMVSGPCSTHPNDCTHWKLDPTTPFSTLCCSHFAPSKDFESHLICWKRRVLL
jgi:hypothetical protein